MRPPYVERPREPGMSSARPAEDQRTANGARPNNNAIGDDADLVYVRDRLAQSLLALCSALARLRRIVAEDGGVR
jgi:hypothetical protein